MPRCIFCRSENENLADEHVFMAAIGGKLTVNGSCVQCNNALNKALEEQMARRFTHFRRVVRTSDRKGGLPVIDVKVEVNGKELDAELMPDGRTQLKPVFTKIVKDGVKEIVGVSDGETERGLALGVPLPVRTNSLTSLNVSRIAKSTPIRNVKAVYAVFATVRSISGESIKSSSPEKEPSPSPPAVVSSMSSHPSFFAFSRHSSFCHLPIL
jgi:hypothetical protein